MKIRIKGNSIRFRLTKSEVEAFGKNGYIEERTEFGKHLFMYALRVNPDAKELMASFVGIKITMQVPTRMAEEWTTTNEVGYSNVYTYDNGQQLSLLLEKDFVCLDAAVTEDQSDNFENPLHTCGPVPQVVATDEAPQVVEAMPAPQPEVQYEIIEAPVKEHYELVDESLPANVGETVEPALTPVELNEEFTTDLTGEQCPVAEELVGNEHKESLMIADEAQPTAEQYPVVEMPAHEAERGTLMVADEPAIGVEYATVEMPAHEAVTEAIVVSDEPTVSVEYPAAEMPAHEAVPEAFMVSDEPSVSVGYPPVEMPAHEAERGTLMVSDESVVSVEYPALEVPAHEAERGTLIVADEPPVAQEPSAPAAEEGEAQEPHWKSFWETSSPAEEVKNEAIEQPSTNTEQPNAPVAEVEEKHPWLEPEIEESLAAPMEPPTSPAPPRTGPVRPPNWR